MNPAAYDERDGSPEYSYAAVFEVRHMADDAPTMTAVKIAEIDQTVKQLSSSFLAMQNQLHGVDEKLGQMVALQMRYEHTSQALERAFGEIKRLAEDSERRWAQNARDRLTRTERFEIWKEQNQAERVRLVNMLTEMIKNSSDNANSTIAGWKGGLKMLYALSFVVWGLVGYVGDSYLRSATMERERIEREMREMDAAAANRSAINSERLRVIELYLSKNPDFRVTK